MAYMDYRLRRLLMQCEAACSDGHLTKAMLNMVSRETLAYREPTGSDIRLLLIDMCPGITPPMEIRSHLRQAQIVLNTVADYD